MNNKKKSVKIVEGEEPAFDAPPESPDPVGK